MKRLLYLILIITLPLIAFFMFDAYRRHHPEANYAFVPEHTIDVNYYDPDVLLRYHQLCEEVGAYGYYCWRKEKVDVLRSNTTDGEAGPMVKRYQELIAVARYLEGKLHQSQKWKAEGFSNEEIRLKEQGRQTVPESAQSTIPLVQLGAQSPLVLAVQQKLRKKGYTLLVDGIFRSETESAISAFQEKEGLNVNGNIDLVTVEQLWR